MVFLNYVLVCLISVGVSWFGNMVLLIMFVYMMLSMIFLVCVIVMLNMVDGLVMVGSVISGIV